ncbi:MAG: hypothetical protein ACRCSU_08595 [Paracoccaceae bacterium]
MTVRPALRREDLLQGIHVRHLDGRLSRYRLLPDGLIELCHDRADGRADWRRVMARGVFTLEHHSPAGAEHLRPRGGITTLPEPRAGLDWHDEAILLRPGKPELPVRIATQSGPARPAQIGACILDVMLATVVLTGQGQSRREGFSYLPALGIGILMGDGLRAVDITVRR